jgi:hypothetical protein
MSPHPISLISVLILCFNLLLCLPTDLFHLGFPTKTLRTFLFSSTRLTFPAYLILRDLIILIMFGEEHKLQNSVLCSFLQPSTISSLFSPNILLSNLFPNTFSLFHSK